MEELMHSAFQYNAYVIKKQVFALTGKLRFYTPDGSLVLYSEQKMFKLREDIRIFSDESKSQELLWIKARNILDFSAAYDVVDSIEQRRVGVLRRKGIQSLLRDQWEVLDANENLAGILQEDQIALALLRRFLLGSLLPQNYDLLVGDTRAVDLRQRFNPFRYEMDVEFSGMPFDRRLGLAAGTLLAIIEGKQSK
jgi:uncharacterized protein YxjI